MDYTPEMFAKVKAAKSAEEIRTLAAENGITITEEEAKGYFAQLHKEFTSLADAALSDEELEQVAGGKGGASTPNTAPIMDPMYEVGQIVLFSSNGINHRGVIISLEYVEMQQAYYYTIQFDDLSERRLPLESDNCPGEVVPLEIIF